MRLLDEIGRLREANTKSTTADPREASLKSWLARADQLKEITRGYSAKSIPEFQLLSEQPWLNAARDATFNSDKDVQKELADLRRIDGLPTKPGYRNRTRPLLMELNFYFWVWLLQIESSYGAQKTPGLQMRPP